MPVRLLPDNAALLWKVRAPVGTRASPGLLEQSYSGDPARVRAKVRFCKTSWGGRRL